MSDLITPHSRRKQASSRFLSLTHTHTHTHTHTCTHLAPDHRLPGPEYISGVSPEANLIHDSRAPRTPKGKKEAEQLTDAPAWAQLRAPSSQASCPPSGACPPLPRPPAPAPHPTHTPPSTQLKPSQHKHSLYNQPQPTEVSFYPLESQLRPPPGFPQRGSGHPRGADQGGGRLPPRPRAKLNAAWDSPHSIPLRPPCLRQHSQLSPLDTGTSSGPAGRRAAAAEGQRDRRTVSLGTPPTPDR